MKSKRLLTAAALICAIAMLGGCSSDTPNPDNSNSETVSSTLSTAEESAAVTEEILETETLDEPEFDFEFEETQQRAIPEDAFKFSSSEYADSDFSSYRYSHGYAGKSQSVTIYRYEDYLVLIVYHYTINQGSYKEVRVLNEAEGKDFLSKEEKHVELKKDSDVSSQTPAVGGIEEYAVLSFIDIDSDEIQIEPLDLSKIDFELPKVSDSGSFFEYDYPESRWKKIFAGDEENTKKYFGVQSEQFPENHSIPFSLSVPQLDCVITQIEDITGGEVEKAKFTGIGDDSSIIEATLKSGETYTVLFNYDELVFDIS